MTAAPEWRIRFDAEQAVKKHLGDRHVPWHWIDEGNAGQIHGADVTDAYRAALIEAHRAIDEKSQALVKNQQFHEQQRREAMRDNERKVTERVERAVGNFSRARDALAVVVAAERHGRKTVRVSDVIDVYRAEDGTK